MEQQDYLWGFKIPEEGNFNVVAILAHTGIVGEKDDLFVIDSNFKGEFKEQIKILYQFAKLQGKFVSWRNCLIDLNYLETGQIMVLPQWLTPFIWSREVNYCIPNEGIPM